MQRVICARGPHHHVQKNHSWGVFYSDAHLKPPTSSPTLRVREREWVWESRGKSTFDYNHFKWYLDCHSQATTHITVSWDVSPVDVAELLYRRCRIGAAGCYAQCKTMNPAAAYKGFNISINRAQLQKTARLERWNFDLKTLSEALLFRNTHNTQTAGWREGVSTHTPSCLEPFSTKIAVERWSLNCWLIPWLCLNWTLTARKRQIAPCVTSS